MVTMRRGKANAVRKLGTLNACSFLTFAAVVFRLELLGLLAPIVLLSLISRRVTFWQLSSFIFRAALTTHHRTFRDDLTYRFLLLAKIDLARGC